MSGRPSRELPLDELFGALADPTRRELLQRLIHHGPDTATRLAQRSELTRQGVSKHLGVLLAAGLVDTEREGREVVYRATPEPLASVVAWLVEASPGWDRRVGRLRRAAVRPS